MKRIQRNEVVSTGKRALVVGINDYDAVNPLSGAINDAVSVARLLCRHSNGDPNYDCITLTSDQQRITRAELRSSLEQLFRSTGDEVLFYFSGHGTVTPTGGVIVTQDAALHDEGISLDELLKLANQSGSPEAIIILDCCFSGGAGNQAGTPPHALLGQNVTILAASRHNEVSMEINSRGVFTELLVDALEGAAADMLGNVTLPAVYAHVSGALGPWDQRPIYKTHADNIHVIRKAEPRIQLSELRQLTALFPCPDFEYALSAEYEYDKTPMTEKQKLGRLFKRYRDASLITTVKPDLDLYWAAIEGESIKLTRLGHYSWRLIRAGRI